MEFSQGDGAYIWIVELSMGATTYVIKNTYQEWDI